MIRVEQSVEVNRPVEEVFAFMNEMANIFKWSQQIDEIRQLTPGPIQLGSKFEIVSRFLGRRITSVLTVSEFIPNQIVKSQGEAGGMQMTSSTTYSSEGENTLMKMETEMEPSGWWKLIAPFLPGLIRRLSTIEHKLLRESLEKTIQREQKNMKILDISETVVSVQ
jgi:uncharacterized membrane protein